MYPTRNAHTPYCYPWPVRLCNIFPHYVIKGTLFEKQKFVNIGLALLYSFCPKRRTEGDMMKNMCWSSCKLPVILVRF